MTANVRFLQNNLASAEASTVTSLTAVSGYPASNSTDERRWKRWRVGGAFVVTSSNNSIYINDGSNKTVTLASATYTTPSLFAAHVQTQLNGSSSNWTVTWSSTTGKFTVGRSSGTALLRLSVTTSAAWDTIGFTGAIDDDVGTGQAADVRRNHTSECWTVDLGAATAVTAFAVIAASGEVFPISDIATLRLRGSNTNNSTSPWTTYDEAFTVTRSDDMLLAFFSGTYRYWQFEWIDRTNTDGPNVELSVVYLGDYIEPAARNIDIGFERTLVDPSVSSESESGVMYHRSKTKYWRYESLTVDWLIDSDRTEVERLVKEMGKTTPFFVSLDPSGEVSEDICEFTKYVIFDGDPQLTHNLWKYHGASFALREVIG